jgi:hypothetical protein
VPPPDPAAPEGQLGFTFDRSGYRVPAIVISLWVAEGQLFNQEHRHTSLIATLREQWALGDPLTARDAAGRTFTHTLTLDTPRPPHLARAGPAPGTPYIQDALGLGQTITAIGTTVFNGIRAYAEQNNIQIEGLPADPEAEIPQNRHSTSSTTSSPSNSPAPSRHADSRRHNLTPRAILDKSPNRPASAARCLVIEATYSLGKLGCR